MLGALRMTSFLKSQEVFFGLQAVYRRIFLKGGRAGSFMGIHCYREAGTRVTVPVTLVQWAAPLEPCLASRGFKQLLQGMTRQIRFAVWLQSFYASRLGTGGTLGYRPDLFGLAAQTRQGGHRPP